MLVVTLHWSASGRFLDNGFTVRSPGQHLSRKWTQASVMLRVIRDMSPEFGLPSLHRFTNEIGRKSASVCQATGRSSCARGILAAAAPHGSGSALTSCWFGKLKRGLRRTPPFAETCAGLSRDCNPPSRLVPRRRTTGAHTSYLCMAAFVGAVALLLSHFVTRRSAYRLPRGQ